MTQLLKYQNTNEFFQKYESFVPRKMGTLEPIVTGTSVIAIKYKDGVVVAADTLASYGSLARFMKLERLHKIGKETLIGVSGEISDFQFMVKELQKMNLDDYCWDDKVYHTPREIWNYVSRRMYYQRSNFDPLYNQLVVAGMDGEKPFLAYVDLHGTHYEDNTIGTGYGGYMARPLLRNAYREDLTYEEARKVVEDCMRILFYRDARALNRVQFANITKDGVTISEPVELTTQWEFEDFITSGFM